MGMGGCRDLDALLCSSDIDADTCVSDERTTELSAEFRCFGLFIGICDARRCSFKIEVASHLFSISIACVFKDVRIYRSIGISFW